MSEPRQNYYAFVIIWRGFVMLFHLWKTMFIHNYTQLTQESLWITVDNPGEKAKNPATYGLAVCG